MSKKKSQSDFTPISLRTKDHVKLNNIHKGKILIIEKYIHEKDEKYKLVF